MKRKGRLYVTCDKVPKHKQRQGFATGEIGEGVSGELVGKSGESGWGCAGSGHAPSLNKLGGVSLTGVSASWRQKTVGGFMPFAERGGF